MVADVLAAMPQNSQEEEEKVGENEAYMDFADLSESNQANLIDEEEEEVDDVKRRSMGNKRTSLLSPPPHLLKVKNNFDMLSPLSAGSNLL